MMNNSAGASSALLYFVNNRALIRHPEESTKIQTEVSRSRGAVLQSTTPLEAKTISDKPGSNKRRVIIGLGIFLAALLLTLAFHFSAEGPKRTLCFDARQYIFDTSKITEFLIAAFHGQWHTQILCEPAFVSSILADGPAFPSIFGTVFALCGHLPDIQDCRLIETVQSVMHAMSSCIIYALTLCLSRRLIPAVCSGLFWAFYPAAIFWSGIFYTETTVILSTLLFVSALSMAQRKVMGFGSGLLAGLVALLKPALLPAAAVSSLLAYRLNKRSFLLLILGGAVALAPWVCYTKALTGQARITANRFPAFNLAMGADTEVDACLVSPAPPLTSMFAKDDAMPYVFPLAQWQFHTADCLRLSCVKLSSLWSRQANDFRQSFFGIPPGAQQIWHLFLIFLGVAGTMLFAWRLKDKTLSQTQKTLGNAALIFILSHFCYVLFTPAARYGMTAMPFFVIFAGFALSHLCKDFAQLRIRSSICAVVSGLILLALVNGTKLSPIFEAPEIAHVLKAGESVAKYIDLSKLTEPASIYGVLLLVDGDNAIENAQLEFNGHPLAGHLQHIRTFDSKLYLQSFELRSLGYPAGISTNEFRHWHAIVVPTKFINWKGSNTIKLTQNQIPSLVYGDPVANRRMLATDSFSVNSLCNSDTRLDLRIPSPILTGNINEQSTLVSGAKATPLTDSLRFKLAVALGESYKAKALSESPLFKQDVSYKNFDLYMQDPAINGLRSNRISMKAARSMGTVVELPDLGASSLIRVKVEGDVKGRNSGKGEVVVALQPAVQSAALVLNMAPQNIEYNKEWRHFIIEDTVPSKLLKTHEKHSIYVAVYPGPWLDFSGYIADKHCGDAQYRNISVELNPREGPDFANKRILFY